MFKNNSEAGENKNNKEEQKLLNEIVLQMQKNKQDSNCSETLHYSAHCDYATKRKFDLKKHMRSKHSPKLNQEDVNHVITNSTQYAPNEDIDEAIEVWKIYKFLQRMKKK